MSSSPTSGTSSQNAIRTILQPIKASLLLAGMLAALGAALTMLPIIGITYAVALWATDFTLPNTLMLIEQSPLWSVFTLSAFALLVGMILLFASETIAHLADNRLTTSLRQDIARHLTQVPLGWFQQHSSAEIKQAMHDDVSTLHELTAHFYTNIGRNIGTIVPLALYLIGLDWRLGLLSLIPFLGYYFAFKGALNSTKEENMRRFMDGQNAINHAVVELVQGAATLKTFARPEQRTRSYTKAVESFLDGFLAFTQPLVTPLANANAIISPIAVVSWSLICGTALIFAGWATFIEVLPFILIAPCFSSPLQHLVFASHALNGAKGAAVRLEQLRQTETLPQVDASDFKAPIDSSIQFQNISFQYSESNPILTDLSFTVDAGQTVAIVGESGAGKSTLAQLLLRFFDPSSGAIRLGQVDIKEMPLNTVYRHVGFVLQKPQLIRASLRDNIALGKPDATLEEIEHAAQLANIDELIQGLAKGYDSIVAEDIQLSQGEKQRLSIARALLIEPDVLVLDEPTASVDLKNEHAIQQALSHLAQNKTLLIIAHRLHTIQHADQIIVLDQGRICEQGTHSTLMNAKGRYYRLWQTESYLSNDQQEQPAC